VRLVVGRWNIAYVNCIINIPGIPSPQISRLIRLLHSQKKETPPHSTAAMAEIFSKRHFTSNAGHEVFGLFMHLRLLNAEMLNTK
jgi:hypothetical protein